LAKAGIVLTATPGKSAKTPAAAISREFTSGSPSLASPHALHRPSRIFTILSSNNAPTPLTERRADMKPEGELPLRSEVMRLRIPRRTHAPRRPPDRV